MRLSQNALEDIEAGALIDAVAKHTQTTGGRTAIQRIIAKPLDALHDASTLHARRQDMLMPSERLQQLRKTVALAAQAEAALQWLAREGTDLDPEAEEFLNTPYFRTLPILNHPLAWPALGLNNVYATLAAPAIAISAPLAYLAAPAIILRRRLGIRLSPAKYLYLLYHLAMASGDLLALRAGRMGAAILQLATLAATLFVYVQAVVNTLAHARAVAQACSAICENLNLAAGASAKGWNACAHRWGTPQAEEHAGLTAGPRYRRLDPRAGRALAQFRDLDRPRLRRLLETIHTLDAVAALATWRREAQLPVCVTAGPGVLARGLWHPATPPARRAAHDVALVHGLRQGMLVTGCNASGKSTLLRTVALAAVMAHSVGFVCAGAAAIAPLQFLHTHLRVRDTPERSRFQAEHASFAELTELAANLAPHHNALLVADEPFASTCPDRATKCIERVLQDLAGTPRMLALVATHHPATPPGKDMHEMHMVKGAHRLAPGRVDPQQYTDADADADADAAPARPAQ